MSIFRFNLRSNLTRIAGTLHEDLYTLHEDPYTLHEDLYTLHEDLYALHEDLYALHEDLYILHEDLYTFQFIACSSLFRIRNVSRRRCKKNQNTHFMLSNLLSKIMPFMT